MQTYVEVTREGLGSLNINSKVGWATASTDLCRKLVLGNNENDFEKVRDFMEITSFQCRGDIAEYYIGIIFTEITSF